eukprot:gene4064-14153_t
MQCARTLRSVSRTLAPLGRQPPAVASAFPHAFSFQSEDIESRRKTSPHCSLQNLGNLGNSRNPLRSPSLFSPRRSLSVTSAALMPVDVIAPAMAAFTPQQAALGGLILAIATTGKLLLNGRILGIAGGMKGFVQNDISPWRIMFMSGMIIGTLPIGYLVGPSAFDVIPDTVSLTRMAISGFMVGYGASLANGCTSGHCISGNARLAPRSLAFTAMFMSFGVVSATLTGTMAAYGVVPNAAQAILPFVAATSAEVQSVLAVAAAAATTFIGLAALAPKMKEQAKLLDNVGEFAAGFYFSLGLAFCGMSHPTKLAGFLAPFNGGWDPSLIFVMGTAVVGSALAHQSLLNRLPLLPAPLKEKPIVTDKYALPPVNGAITGKLIIGGILFGLGVGGSGLCPGPDICNVIANYTPQVSTHLGAMLFGLFMEGFVSKQMAAAPVKA